MFWLKKKIVDAFFLKRDDRLLLKNYVKVGYYNGLCPLCKDAIGTDVFEKKIKIKMRYYAWCGVCKKEIGLKIDKMELTQ